MTYLKLFLSFMKIGLIGFGGGIAILPLIYESVSGFNAMTAEEFANLFAISQATPGPIGVNAATFAGFKVAGVFGAICSTLGVAVPSFVLVTLIARAVDKYSESPLVKGAFEGIRPATVGMIGAGVIYIAKTAIFTGDTATYSVLADYIAGLNPIAIVMALISLVLTAKFKVGTVKVIVIMGAAGALLQLIL